ncbi:MAG: glycosyltransferase, partial [Candidatus Margulisbacteria bacterium]|nr:glycosyltransferase [Candidatus Margulisiibacteriota bacterium]
MSKKSKELSVILPTFNEVENIPVIIPQIMNTLAAAHIDGEVIVVDDNSPDATAEAAKRLSQHYPVEVIVRTQDRGLSRAVLAGFEHSEATVCVVMDADGSHPVSALPEMVLPILKDEVDCTVGSRNVSGGDSTHWPWYRKVISKSASVLTMGLTSMSDPTSG